MTEFTQALASIEGFEEAMELGFTFFLERFSVNSAADEKWMASKAAINPVEVTAALRFIAAYMALQRVQSLMDWKPAGGPS